MSSERGASAVIIAILMAVLLGFGALVIDVGALYRERRELQNGADAAVLAVAQGCAVESTCPTTSAATARTFADSNADDLSSGVSELCGGSASGLGTCGPAAYAHGYNPPPLPPQSARVTTETLTSGGGTEIIYRLARVLGIAGTGKTVRATAAAAWGVPSRVTTLPLSFSLCEWNGQTSGGTNFATPTGGTPPYSGTLSVIKFHDGNANVVAADCAAQAGQDTDGDLRLPGGFGWLDSGAGIDCGVTVDANGWVTGQTGNAPPNDCSPTDLLNTEILIPIFDDLWRSGGSDPPPNPSPGTCVNGGGCYHIEGFAAFYVTGFRLSGNTWTENSPCSAPANCIGGYFVRHVSVAEALGPSGTPNLGVVVVDPIG